MKYVKSLMGKNKLLFQKTLNNLINTLRRADILIFFCHCLEYETKEHINNLLIIFTKNCNCVLNFLQYCFLLSHIN